MFTIPLCRYYRNDTGCAATKDKPWGPAQVSSVSGCSAPDPGSTTTVCDAVPLDAEVQRLCACTGGGLRARHGRSVAAEEMAAPNQAGGGSPGRIAPAVLAKRWLSRTRKSSAGTRTAPAAHAGISTWVAATAVSMWLALSGGGGGGTPLLVRGALATAAALVALPAAPAAAHNWMMTPSRSYKKAAATMPCILRKVSGHGAAARIAGGRRCFCSSGPSCLMACVCVWPGTPQRRGPVLVLTTTWLPLPRATQATDTHQQVGPNQSFVMKFSVGHAGDTGAQCIYPIKDVRDPKCIPIGKEYTAIVLINAEDYHWLSHADYALFVEDYMTHAPQTDHMDPRWSRYHGIPESSCGNCDGLGEDRGGTKGFIDFASMTKAPEPPAGSNFHMPGRDAFAFTAAELASEPEDSDHIPLLDKSTPADKQLYLQRLKKSSPHWPDHAFAKTEAVFRLSKKALKNDRRSTYYNPKYPWIISAGIYQHQFQRPSDYAAVRLTVPETHGGKRLEPGHYIAHYRWKGYSDCTDINLHRTEMDNVDGVDEDKYVWNKIDHCQYNDPKRIMTQCKFGVLQFIA